MGKQSSSTMSSLAAEVLNTERAQLNDRVTPHRYNELLEKAKRLAGSVMSQDETPGQEETNGSDGGLGGGRSEPHSRR